MTVSKMTDLDLRGKRVLIRENLNVLVKDGQVQSDARIETALLTLKLALEKGTAVMVCSHLGRPTEGELPAESSLKPMAGYLFKALGREVPLLADYLDGVEIRVGDLVLFENVCSNKGEKKNADELAQRYAALCDMSVMDAFGTARHAEGSTHGMTRSTEIAAAGPLLATELDALDEALDNPARPMTVIITGSRVSTKLDVLNSLAGICDQLIVGDDIANTLLAAAGHRIGKSLYEADLVGTAKAITAKIKVPLPVDVVVVKEFTESAVATVKTVTEVADGDMILDIDPQTAAQSAELLKTSKIILQNGPAGVFEFDQFGEGTCTLVNAVAGSVAFSIVGSGNTLAAIDRYGIAGRISYISTDDGAFLEFIEGRVLPAVEILEQHTKGWRRWDKLFAVLSGYTFEDDEERRYPMRSVTLPLLMFRLGLVAYSGDGGRRLSTCEVVSPPDAMVPTEQNRQRIEQQSSGDPTAGQKPVECPWCFSASFYGKGWGFASVRSSIMPFLQQTRPTGRRAGRLRPGEVRRSVPHGWRMDMNYSRIVPLDGLVTAALLAGYSGSSGKSGGKGWARQACDGKAVIEWRYIDGSKNIVDLRLRDKDDMVHHLEQEPAAVGAFYSGGRLGFHLESDEGLVYWVETDDLIGRGCKAR